jgi:integrase
VSHVEEERQILRRLGGRARQPKAQSLPQQKSSRSPPGENAHPLVREAARPPYTTASATARAWSEAQSQHSAKRVARELAQKLEEKGEPAIAIASLLAGWQQTLGPDTRCTYSVYLRKCLAAIDSAMNTHTRQLVKLPRRPPPRATIATPQEIEALWNAAPAAWKYFLAATTALALRFTEAVTSGPKHYDPANNSITIRTKGGKVRTFPVTPQMKALIDICPPTAETFMDGLAGRPSSRNGLRDQWEKLKKQANVRAELIPHDLRRTAAVRAYQATGDVFAAKALLGHDALTTTARYLRPHEPEALRVLEKTWFSSQGPKQ